MQNFQSLGLSEPIIRALNEAGITEPTPIQKQAIPQLVDRATDFLGLAQTGTGKTAAFGLPLIEQIDPGQNAIQAVILSPTRELAQQIAAAIKSFGKYIPRLSVEVVYGGTSVSNQVSDLKRNQPKILVATPGRLIDLIDRKALNLSNVRFVILDEADEMLNMGFKDDIDTILSFTQEDKNTWLFSATMPKEIREIVHRYMYNPIEISVSTGNQVNTNIEHKYAMVRRRDKRAALQRIIDSEGDMYALIFCRTKNDTQELSVNMSTEGYPVEAIHGDLSQAQRNNVMRKFKSGSVKLLAATDVAARGIDVDNLTHVIHYDMPDDLSFYTHRSGRTARAGKTGVAVALIAPEEQRKVFYLEKQLGIKFKKMMIPSAEEVVLKSLQNRVDDILETDPSEDALIFVNTFTEQFEGLSKEDLIARWLTMNLQGMKKKGNDLNATESERRERDRNDRGRKGKDRDRKHGKERERDRNRDRDRHDKKKGEKKDHGYRDRSGGIEEGMSRFYINIGKKDKLRKGDVLKMICDASGVRSKYMGRIQMFENHVLVDIMTNRSKGFETSLEGLKFEGRGLKVNREN